MEGRQKCIQQKYILLVMMITAGVFMLAPVAGIGQPSVLFFDHPILGPYFMAPNLTFQQGSALKTFYGYNSCKCRAACFSIGRACQAWSFLEKRKEESECRLTHKGPRETNLTDIEDASYFFKQSSVGGRYTWGTDKLLYAELKDRYYFHNAKEHCAMIPGHRLTIAHSDVTYNFFIHYKSLYRYGDVFWANLVKIGEKVAQWGDGTNQTEIQRKVDMTNHYEKYFVAYHHDHIHDTKDNGAYGVLCQANPLAIVW